MFTAVPPFAQDASQPTISITQDQINSSTAFTKPYSSRLSKISATMSSGAVKLTFTYTGRGNKTYNLAVVMTPTLKNLRMFWKFNPLTINGKAAPRAQLNAFERITVLLMRLSVRPQLLSQLVALDRQMQKAFYLSGLTVANGALNFTLATK
jgi:hypothetical protein